MKFSISRTILEILIVLVLMFLYLITLGLAGIMLNKIIK